MQAVVYIMDSIMASAPYGTLYVGVTAHLKLVACTQSLIPTIGYTLFSVILCSTRDLLTYDINGMYFF